MNSVSVSSWSSKQRPSCADIALVNRCIPGNFNIFNTVNLFTTTTKQNPTTQHALGRRSAEIYKVPPTGETLCFPQDRNLDSGFIGIGQCSGLRTLFKLFTQPLSHSFSEGTTCPDKRIAEHSSYSSVSLQSPIKPSFQFCEFVLNDEPFRPGLTGSCKFPGLYPFL